MKTPARVASIRRVGICGLLVAAVGLLNHIRAYEAPMNSRVSTNTLPASGLLNLVLQGPFVIERTKTNIVVMIPNAPNHTVPVLEDAHTLSPRGFNAGEYTLDISGTGSGAAKITNPVAGTTILRASGKSENLSSDPHNLRYLRMVLPLPEEIVPWNADPVWVSTISPIPPETEAVRLAVLVVLRYPFSGSTMITLSGKERDGTAINDSLTSIPYGAEHFLFLVQGMKNYDIVDHPTALASFDKMKELEPPLTRFLSFPDLGTTVPGRNQPLLPNVVPKDLTDYLTANAPVSASLTAAKGKYVMDAKADVNMLIAHSDCRAPILYVDYTQ